jgi:hypothetical protein
VGAYRRFRALVVATGFNRFATGNWGVCYHIFLLVRAYAFCNDPVTLKAARSYDKHKLSLAAFGEIYPTNFKNLGRTKGPYD